MRDFNLLQAKMTELETLDFYASSKRYATQKMERYIQAHAIKYREMLKIQNLRKINDNLWRCNLTHDHYLIPYKTD